MSELETWLALARAGADALEGARQRLDDLNVYPVPDGDTGTNLVLTARATVEALEAAPPEAGPVELARVLTRGTLLGARGNSGVILSQIVRGALEALAAGGAPAAALAAAREAGYAAVREPVEGTILSMIRELADAADAHGAAQPAELLPALVRRGEEALARTPEQLPLLRAAGVVDAGAAGLLELVRGIAAAVAGEPLPSGPQGEELPLHAVHRERSRYRYCTVFAVEGEALDLAALEQRLEALGDSLLLVGDRTLLKVHVHTDDPGAALSAGSAAGVLDRIEIANMHRQTEEREKRLLHRDGEQRASDVVAVVSGAGNAALFRSLGAAELVDGGDTMNPSAEQILAALERTGGTEAIVLPNSGNVILAARQAAGLASRPARVVPTRSLQEGLGALVAYDFSATADANEASMAEAAAAVGSGAVARAARELELPAGRVRAGDYVGLVAGEPVAGGPGFDDVAAAVVELLLAEPRGVLTLLTGEEEPALESLLALLRGRHPEVELEVHEGGQSHYPLLLAAE